ncbi:MAG TPA: hypothetical protein VMZ28_30105 [Kofleriaceae bacterium]|nr:hypothetical protein [Kofleriaceae bacterium]
MKLAGRLARSHWVAAAVFLLFLLALFWRLWTPIDGARRMFGWDAQWEYWGDLQFQHDAYADGDVPLWNPYDRGGYPFHTDPQAGILYPGTWLILAGTALTGVSYWWIAVKVVAHFWLACFGTWFYLRRREVHPAACYVGGFAFILCYPFLHNVFSALNWSMAWTPWVLAALDAWAAHPTRRRAALLALAAAMCALAGAPGSFWYALLVIVPYGIWAIVASARGSGPRGSPARRDHLRALTATGALVAGLALAMVACQLRSTGSVVGETVRDARDLEFMTFSTFGVDDLAALLMPRMMGGNTYLGAAVIIWAALALTAFVDGRRLLLAGVVVIGFACALGQTGDFLAVGASVFEPFGMFRRAHRYLYVTQLPIAILAAEGLHGLLTSESAELRRKVLRGVLVWGVVVLIVFGSRFAWEQKPTLDPQPLRDAFVLTCLATAIAVWLTSMIATRKGALLAAFAVIAPLFVAADLWFAHGGDVEQRMHALPRPKRDGEVATMEGVPLEARVYDRHYLGYRPGTRLALRDFGGYEDDPLALSRYAAMRDLVERSPRHLGHVNVAWLLEADGKDTRKSPADKLELEQVKKGMHRVKHVAPAVMWADRAEIVDGGAKEAIAALTEGTPGSRVVLERATLDAETARAAAEGDAAAAPVAGRIVSLERNRVVAEVTAPAPGVAVVHESYFPGWVARVNGEERPIVPANGMFRGVRVDAGKQTIEMEYSAPGWMLLAPISMAGFIGALFIAIRRRRESKA